VDFFPRSMAWKTSAVLGVWVVLLASSMVVAAGAPTHAPAAAPAPGADPLFPSQNWGGYADTVTPHSVINVTMEWIEPTPVCTAAHPVTVASIWTGLDGFPSTDPTVEGIGSFVICFYGTPLYHAFYELYPAAPVAVPLAISGGDALVATVSVVGNNLSLYIHDLTTLSTFSTVVPLSSAWSLASAECVVQRDHKAPVELASPVRPAGVLGAQFPYTDYGNLTVRECVVTYPGALPQGIATLGPPAVVYQIAVTKVGAVTYATTGVAAGSVSTFSVAWHHF
jgi:hypothetical protein